MKFSQTMNIQDQKNAQAAHQRNGQGSQSGVGGASKSIFNASYKEMKPSKSVDLTSFNGGASQQTQGAYEESLFNQLSSTLNLNGDQNLLGQLLLREKERVVQIACGSIHTLARTNQHRIFSCGNGSTFALGHKSRDSCSIFKQVEFFNGTEEGGVVGVGIKTIACGLSHSGCVLTDGSVYLWGIAGDVSYNKEFLDKCLLKRPTKISFKDNSSGGLSQRRRSNASGIDDSQSVIIEEIKLGEQFSMALTSKGQLFTWGLNDKGQLGLGNESFTADPQLVTGGGIGAKVISKIECGLKHCVALTKDYQMYVWGSNSQLQLGTKKSAPFVNIPTLSVSYADAKPFKVACGSYYTVCLSYRMPRQEEHPEVDENSLLAQQKTPLQVLGQKSINEESKFGGPPPQYQHDDDSCPNMEQIKKLKGEIKRLRLDLLKGGSSRRHNEAQELNSDDSDLDEEEKVALQMLSPDQRRYLAELEQSGASKAFVKKSIKRTLIQ